MSNFEINICHLYPDLMNLYGDRGNIMAMQRRLEWRGIRANVTEISIGDPLNWQDYDIFFIGGGQEFEQKALLDDIHSSKGDAIKAAIEAGKVFLTVCGGYQLLAKDYISPEGKKLNLIGAIDMHVKGGKDRLVGNYMFQMANGNKVVAFENHASRTFLGQGVKPLGKVLAGKGNNGQDGTEGVRYKNVFGTYGHGSLLPKNPALCDLLLKLAIDAKYPGMQLQPLEDKYEKAAHRYMVERLSK